MIVCKRLGSATMIKFARLCKSNELVFFEFVLGM